MVVMLGATLKESMSKVVDKSKEIKNTFENLETTENKEFSEIRRKFAQEADTETAMSSSLRFNGRTKRKTTRTHRMVRRDS